MSLPQQDSTSNPSFLKGLNLMSGTLAAKGKLDPTGRTISKIQTCWYEIKKGKHDIYLQILDLRGGFSRQEALRGNMCGVV